MQNLIIQYRDINKGGSRRGRGGGGMEEGEEGRIFECVELKFIYMAHFFIYKKN